MNKTYWKIAYTALRRKPPACMVSYIPAQDEEMRLHIYITRPETPIEWAVAFVGTLLGRNRFMGSHVCCSCQNMQGKVVQFDMTFDGIQSYYNENPLRDVHYMLSVPITFERYIKWIGTINTIEDLKLKVQVSDVWRWLFKLPVNISCVSIINLLLFDDNTHLDPDTLILKVLNDTITRVREKLSGEESLS